MGAAIPTDLAGPVIGGELQCVRKLALGILELVDAQRIEPTGARQLSFQRLPGLARDADGEQIDVEDPDASPGKPGNLGAADQNRAGEAEAMQAFPQPVVCALDIGVGERSDRQGLEVDDRHLVHTPVSPAMRSNSRITPNRKRRAQTAHMSDPHGASSQQASSATAISGARSTK